MTTIGGIDPSFSGQQTGGEPPYVRLTDPARIFGIRARRFEAVARDSEITDYVIFMAHLAKAQGEVANALPVPMLDAEVHRVIEHGMPPLSRDLAAGPGALATLNALITVLKAAKLAEGPAAIVAALGAADDTDRGHMLQSVADGLFEIARLGESALVAAALQVWYSIHAMQLDVPRLRNIGETICPCCGGAPASSMVVGWPEAQGNRYLACSLCLAMWNHVRVKCTACSATKGISYRSVEGSTGDVAAEVCETCGGYIKHLVQTKNSALDPIADDVASYGLDLMLREGGWRRTGLNPFLVLT